MNVKEMELMSKYYALWSQKMGVNIEKMNYNFFQNFMGGVSPVGFGAVTGAATKAAGLGAGFLTGGFAGSMGARGGGSSFSYAPIINTK